MKKVYQLIFGCSLLVSPSAFAQLGEYSIRVEVAGNGFAHFTRVFFDDEPYTYGFDPCCEGLMVLGGFYQPHVYTEVLAPPLPPNSDRLAINALPLLFEPISIPLGFLPGTLAAYDFTFKELYRFPATTTIELEDLALNVTQDLLADSVYSTWGAPSDDVARFLIHIDPHIVTSLSESDQKNDVALSIRGREVHTVLTGADVGGMLTVYDASGRVVLSDGIRSNHAITPLWNLPDGVYLLVFHGEDGKFSSLKVALL